MKPDNLWSSPALLLTWLHNSRRPEELLLSHDVISHSVFTLPPSLLLGKNKPDPLVGQPLFVLLSMLSQGSLVIASFTYVKIHVT